MNKLIFVLLFYSIFSFSCKTQKTVPVYIEYSFISYPVSSGIFKDSLFHYTKSYAFYIDSFWHYSQNCDDSLNCDYDFIPFNFSVKGDTLIKSLAITGKEYLNFTAYPFAVLNTSTRIKNTTEEYDLLISDTAFNTGGHSQYLGDTLIVLNNELHNCHIIKRNRGLALTSIYYISTVLYVPLITVEKNSSNEIESKEIITLYEKNSVRGKKYRDKKEEQLGLKKKI